MKWCGCITCILVCWQAYMMLFGSMMLFGRMSLFFGGEIVFETLIRLSDVDVKTCIGMFESFFVLYVQSCVL